MTDGKISNCYIDSCRCSGAQRRQQILNTARDIIFTDGINRLTIRNLAAKIGISEPALYRYFKNKEELIMELLASLFDPWRDEMSRTAGNSLDSRSALEALAGVHIDFLLNHRLNPLLFFSEASSPGNEKILEFLQYNLKFLISLVTDIFKRGIAGGEFESALDPAVAAGCVISLFQNSIIRWTVMRTETGLKRQLTKNLQFLLNLLPAGLNHNNKPIC